MENESVISRSSLLKSALIQPAKVPNISSCETAPIGFIEKCDDFCALLEFRKDLPREGQGERAAVGVSCQLIEKEPLPNLQLQHTIPRRKRPVSSQLDLHQRHSRGTNYSHSTPDAHHLIPFFPFIT
jgi:hypothetical protein